MTKQTDEDGWWRFLTLCKKQQTTQEFDEFFDLFLTFEERAAIADRCRIITDLLKKEKTQRDISAQYGVSIATITRGSNYLKTISSDLRTFLESNLLS